MKAEEKLIAKRVFDMLVQEGLITERIKEQALKNLYTKPTENTDLSKTA